MKASIKNFRAPSMQIIALFAITILLTAITPVQADSYDDTLPAAKIDKPVITLLNLKPSELQANSENDLKIILKFSDKKANLRGGTLSISIMESSELSHEFEFKLEHKKFNKEKGRFKFKTNLAIGNCDKIRVEAQLKDSSNLKSQIVKMEMVVEGADDGGGGGGGNGGSDKPWGVHIGERAINFSLRNHDGKQVNLHDYAGSVILLDFSTMWCGPCQAESSEAEGFYQKYKEQGFIILTVLFQDYGGNPISAEDCRSWCERFGLTFPVLADTDSGAWNKYDEEGYVPLNLVIDRDLVIQYKQPGFSRSAIEQLVIQLLGS